VAWVMVSSHTIDRSSPVIAVDATKTDASAGGARPTLNLPQCCGCVLFAASDWVR
jgi:hypothetical protein